ncbi:MAG: hypothetical protein WD845_17990 [Pirellulales bacterium]
MPLNKNSRLVTPFVLAGLLLLEAGLVVSLRTLGWLGTGSAIGLIICTLATFLPLLIGLVLLARNRLRFGLRALMACVALVAVFVFVSAMPLVDYRSARTATKQLAAANATLNVEFDWDSFYDGMGLKPPPVPESAPAVRLPPWLGPFTESLSAIPTDDAVRSIHLSSDEQVHILAVYSARFSSLQFVSIARGVSVAGLRTLQSVLPHFPQLVGVQVNDVAVPENWYGSLTNIRTLLVWGEGMSRGAPFPPEDLVAIRSLPNLEALMILGYAFNDSDAKRLSSSPSIKRVILRGTAVTPKGESALSNAMSERIIYRN